MAEHYFRKVETWVRFPPSAPKKVQGKFRSLVRLSEAALIFWTIKKYPGSLPAVAFLRGRGFRLLAPGGILC